MKPQEKAKDLVDRFYYMLPNNGSHTGINNVESRYKEAKQCALIAVDEIINCDSFFSSLDATKEFTKYWYEVQEEIEQLR